MSESGSGELGEIVDWHGAEPPAREPMLGRRVRVEPLSVSEHGRDLYAAACGDGADAALWDYLGYGPYDSEPAFLADLEGKAASADPMFFAIIPAQMGTAEGVASLMRIDAANGVGEIGHIWFGPRLQRSVAATEAIYLLANHLMTDRGYRRLEWKCHALNQRSRRAAERFGFRYEGTFRNHLVVKGRNRDTAWYSITDAEWPIVRAGFEAWLDPANFDAHGIQRRTLEDCRTNPRG